jgi:hypothetical protein
MSVPLLAGKDIPQAGFFRRTVHGATLLFIDHTATLILGIVLLGAMLGIIFYLKQRRPRRRRGSRD